MTSLYNCKGQINTGDSITYRITKFNSDMDVESSYTCTETWCECPAMGRPTCRHREMLPKFIARGAVNTHWFLDFDRGGWVSTDWEGDKTAANATEALEAMASCPYWNGEKSLSEPEPVEVSRASSTDTEPRTEPNPTPILRRF